MMMLCVRERKQVLRRVPATNSDPMAFVSTPVARHGSVGWLPYTHRLRPAGVGTGAFAAVERVAKHTSTACGAPCMPAVLKAGGSISMSQGGIDGANEVKAPRRGAVRKPAGASGRGNAARIASATSWGEVKRSKGQRVAYHMYTYEYIC